jgi:hypothetical protein
MSDVFVLSDGILANSATELTSFFSASLTEPHKSAVSTKTILTRLYSALYVFSLAPK